MKIISFFLFFFISIICIGQNDAEPNLDSETFYQPKFLWDLKLKPIKKVNFYQQGKLHFIQEFSKEGKLIKTRSINEDFIGFTEWKYKADLIISYKNGTKYNDPTSEKSKINRIQIFKINFDEFGKILDAEGGQISSDSIYTKLGTTKLDQQGRFIKFEDKNGKSSTNYSYRKGNLIVKENVYVWDNKKDKSIRLYTYNKNNQVVFAESVTEKYFDGALIEKKTTSTTTIKYRGKLPVKKVFKNDTSTKERTYDYDSNGNLIYFTEKEVFNNDNTLKYEKWNKWEYEDNLLVYSETYDSSSTHRDGKESNAVYEYENRLLKKITGTFNVEKDRKCETEFFYNEFKHLVKKTFTILDIDSHSQEEYEIEYY